MVPGVPPPDRKRRADAWEVEAGLSDVQQRKVFAWAQSLGYARALQLIETELQIRPPSMGAFQGWYVAFSRLDSQERVHKAIADSAAIRELAAQGGDVSEAMLAALESEAAAAILSKDPDRIKLLVTLALQARGERRDDEALSLAKAKFQALQDKVDAAKRALEDAASRGKSGGLNDETIDAIEKAAKLL